MNKILFCVMLCMTAGQAYSQSSKTDVYELVKMFLYDSTGYENIGDWAVGKPKKYQVQWKADKIEMSPDTSINFYRMGTADVTIKGKSFTANGQPLKWNVMLKGPRMGYGSFSILSSNTSALSPKITIDSLFANKPFSAKLMKTCDNNNVSGFYYYELKLPKKDLSYIKISWLSVNGSTAIRIDGFDAYSRYSAKLDCPK